MQPIVTGLVAIMICAGGAAATAASFSVTPRNPAHVRLIAYGDQRFTDVAERDASRPFARQALVHGIAETGADAVLMTGDVPWHGGTVNDYAVYAQETAIWRERQMEIFPALGNHEFAGCTEAECLAHWWSANPRLNGTALTSEPAFEPLRSTVPVRSASAQSSAAGSRTNWIPCRRVPAL